MIYPFDISRVDLSELNSLTKYPSIPTYHCVNDGAVSDVIQVVFDEGPVYCFEKIDGVNARLVFCPDGTVIVGSREKLIFRYGDLIADPLLDIAKTLKVYATHRIKHAIYQSPREIVVLYFEVYGHRIGRYGSQYTKAGKVGARLIDVARISIESVNRSYLDSGDISSFAATLGIKCVPMMSAIDSSHMPMQVDATRDFTRAYNLTRCHLDDGGVGNSEGLIVRNADRSRIAKIRSIDYIRPKRVERYRRVPDLVSRDKL